MTLWAALSLLDVPVCRYFKRVDRKGKAREMYPPGPIMFVRPLKHLVRADNGRKSRSGFRIKRTFDAVWITPQELISEGILVSSMVSPIKHGPRGWCLGVQGQCLHQEHG